jgi:hypothetical protein
VAHPPLKSRSLEGTGNRIALATSTGIVVPATLADILAILDGSYANVSGDTFTGQVTIARTGGQVGLDLSAADNYANLRVIRNPNGPDQNLYIGFGQTGDVLFYKGATLTASLSGTLVGTGTRNVAVTAAGVFIPEGGSGWVQTGSVSGWGVNNFIINGCFDANFSHYAMVYNLWSITNNGHICLRYRIGAADYAGSSYTWDVHNTDHVSGHGVAGSAGFTSFHILAYLASGSATAGGVGFIHYPSDALYTACTYHTSYLTSTSAYTSGNNGGHLVDTNVYTGIDIFNSSGGLLYGDVAVFGIRR